LPVENAMWQAKCFYTIFLINFIKKKKRKERNKKKKEKKKGRRQNKQRNKQNVIEMLEKCHLLKRWYVTVVSWVYFHQIFALYAINKFWAKNCILILWKETSLLKWKWNPFGGKFFLIVSRTCHIFNVTFFKRFDA
jgi:ribosomal protein S25